MSNKKVRPSDIEKQWEKDLERRGVFDKPQGITLNGEPVYGIKDGKLLKGEPKKENWEDIQKYILMGFNAE